LKISSVSGGFVIRTVQRIAKNTLALSLTNIFSLFTGLTLTILVARSWGAEGLGRYAFVFAFVAPFSFLTDLGVGLLIIREGARDKAHLPLYVSNALGLSTALSSLTLLLCFTGIYLFKRSWDIRFAVLLAGLNLWVGAYVQILRGSFHALERMEYETVAQALGKISILGGGALAVLLGGGLIELVIAFLGGQLVNLLIGLSIYRRRVGPPRWEGNLRIWKELAARAYPFGLNLIFSTIYIQIDQVMLSLMRGDKELGFYKAAAALMINLPLIAGILNSSLLPIMSRDYLEDKPRLIRLFQGSFRYLFTIGLPIALGTTLLAPRFINLFYGERFGPSVLALQVLIWTIPLRFVNNTLGTVLTSINRQGRRTYIVGIGAGFNLLTNLWFIPRFGYIGASITTLATELLLFGLVYGNVSKFFYRLPIISNCYRTFLAASLMGLAIFLLRSFNLWMLLLASVLLYLGLLYGLGGLSREDREVLSLAFGWWRKGHHGLH